MMFVKKEDVNIMNSVSVIIFLVGLFFRFFVLCNI